jgi:hypothetical protein
MQTLCKYPKVSDEHLLLCLQFSSFNIEATINGSTVMSVIHLASLESLDQYRKAAAPPGRHRNLKADSHTSSYRLLSRYVVFVSDLHKHD